MSMKFVASLSTLMLIVTCTAQAKSIASDVQLVTKPHMSWASTGGLIDAQPQTKITADQVADRLGIQDAFALWGIAFDESRIDLIRTLFTKDGDYSVMIGGNPTPAHYVGAAMIADRASLVMKQHADQRRHAISNIYISNLTKNSADAIAYGVITRAADGLSLTASVIYSAQLKREADGIWRFSKLVIGIDDESVPPVVDPKK